MRRDDRVDDDAAADDDDDFPSFSSSSFSPALADGFSLEFNTVHKNNLLWLQIIILLSFLGKYIS